MIRAFRSELVKMKEPTYGIGVAALVAFMAISLIISVSDPGNVTSNRGPAGVVLARAELEASDGLARSLGNVVTFLGIAVVALVAINIGGEFRLGTVRTLTVRQSHRSRLLLGKTAAFFGYLASAVVVMVALSLPLALLIAARADVDTAMWWNTAGICALLVGVANLIAAAWGWAALGVVLAIVLRSAPATIGVGVAYALPIEILMVELTPDLARWLPGQLFQELARGGQSTIDHAATLAGVAAWTMGALACASAVFRVRDIRE